MFAAWQSTVAKPALAVVALVLCSLGALKLLSCGDGTTLLRSRTTAALGVDGGSYHYMPELCGSGSWKADYTKLHSQIRGGKVPPRYLISIAVSESGLADRLVGVISQFYVALLSNRALVLQTYDDIPGFEAVFDKASVNWSSPGYPRKLWNHLTNEFKGLRVFPNDTDRTVYGHVDHYGSNPTIFYTLRNLTEVPRGHYDIPYVFMISNQGRSFGLFENPYHAVQLRKMGLRPETAFYCAFHYLFRPNHEVMAKARPHLDALSNETTLKIGIHIRTGDSTFVNDNVTSLDPYNAYFECAKEIERTRGVAGRKVVWYLISDSLQLRSLAKQKFGSKLLTDNTTKALYIDCRKQGGKGAVSCQNETGTVAMHTAAVDVLTFSYVDYHVMWHHTGFGKIGAWLSPNWHHVYLIKSLDPQVPPNCGRWDYDSYENQAFMWSGI